VVASAFISWREQYPSFGYVAPFVTLLLLISIPKSLAYSYWEWPLQVLLVSLVCFLTWPAGVSLRPNRWLASAAVGASVFCLWIAPELIAPEYRHSLLFSNGILGHVGSSLQPGTVKSGSILFWRTARAATVVPVAEELFWRAWLMRWLIHRDFQKVPLGSYAPAAFWITAIFFGAEHGPYWDVGLVTGMVYNWWMIRSKSLGDCVLMHAVTNLLLSIYVIAYAQWQYWQ
jgi:CAAX prenyl protease-like protein